MKLKLPAIGMIVIGVGVLWLAWELKKYVAGSTGTSVSLASAASAAPSSALAANNIDSGVGAVAALS